MPFCKSAAEKRYLIRLFLVGVVYILATFVTFHILYHGRTSLPMGLLLAAIPSVPLFAMIAVVVLYLKEEKDDFQRELFIQSLLWGMGGTLALTSFWSFLHLFTHVPPVDGFHVFVIFWVLMGVATIPLRRYYGGASND
jgi:hypothetical protein